MAKTLESLTQLDKYTEIGKSRDLASNDVTRTMGGDKTFPRTRGEVLHRQRQTLAALVDTGDDRLDLLVLFEHILGMLDLFGPRDIRYVHEAVDTLFEFDKCTKIGEIANASDDLCTDRILDVDCIPGIFLKLSHAEADAFLDSIDAEHLYLDFLSLMKQTLGALRTARPRDLRNVNEAFDSRLELNKYAILSNGRYDAFELGVDRIDLNDRRPRVRQQLLIAERDLFLVTIEFQDLDLNVVADLKLVRGVVNAPP